MKNLILVLSIIIILFSCGKKDNVSPQTVTQHDTVTKTVYVHDTAYCTPKSDIIQGTWYCYQYTQAGVIYTQNTSQSCIFTQNTFNWFGNSGSAYFTTDYSTMYLNSSAPSSSPYTIGINNCNEITIYESWSGSLYRKYYLRRNP